MSNWQLAVIVGCPVLTVLAGILATQMRIWSMKAQFAGFGRQIAGNNARADSANAQSMSMNTQLAGLRDDIRLLVVKMIELSGRVSRLEASQGRMR